MALAIPLLDVLNALGGVVSCKLRLGVSSGLLGRRSFVLAKNEIDGSQGARGPQYFQRI